MSLRVHFRPIHPVCLSASPRNRTRNQARNWTANPCHCTTFVDRARIQTSTSVGSYQDPRLSNLQILTDPFSPNFGFSIGLNLERPASLSARHSTRLSLDPRRVHALLNRSRRRASVRLDLIPTRRQKIYSPMNHRCLSTGWLAVAAVQTRTLAAARSQAILSCPESVRGKPCSSRRQVRCRLGRLARCL